MATKPFTLKENLYLECDPHIQFIKTEQDILDLLGNMYPHRKLIVYQVNLDSDFFDLSTGLAGDILQKLANYQVQVAFIIHMKSIKSKRFQELIYETSTNKEYRFFESVELARKWLVEEN